MSHNWEQILTGSTAAVLCIYLGIKSLNNGCEQVRIEMVIWGHKLRMMLDTFSLSCPYADFSLYRPHWMKQHETGFISPGSENPCRPTFPSASFCAFWAAKLGFELLVFLGRSNFWICHLKDYPPVSINGANPVVLQVVQVPAALGED